MKINFENVEAVKMDNFLGGEGSIFMKAINDGKNRIMEITMPSGASIGYHKHETSSEIIRVLSGKLTVTTETETEIILPNEVHYCPKGESHGTKNNEKEPVIIYAIVTQQ